MKKFGSSLVLPEFKLGEVIDKLWEKLIDMHYCCIFCVYNSIFCISRLKLDF